jgi:hypothetical protein
MSPRLQALKYILNKATDEANMLQVYIDDTVTTGMKDHDKLMTMLDLARDILTEAMLP